jgi:hypothetical protein
MRGSPKRLTLVGAWLVAAACGASTPPPEAGSIQGFAPDLRGRRVILLPVQQNLGVLGDVDAELAFGLQDRGRDIDWVLASEVDEMLARSPAVQARTRGLPVGAFTVAEVQRVGDPLYGELRRMAALVNADGVVLPVQAAMVSDTTSLDVHPRVRFWTALIEVRTGRVMWFSVVEGESHPPGDPRGLASAVDEIARSLLWYMG